MKDKIKLANIMAVHYIPHCIRISLKQQKLSSYRSGDNIFTGKKVWSSFIAEKLFNATKVNYVNHSVINHASY